MRVELTQVAGSALVWKAVQLGSVKILFLVRLLVLARLLAPDDFGLLAIAMTASGFFLLVTDFGILPALVQRAEVDEKHYDSAWTLSCIRGLVVTVSLLLTASVIAKIFDEPRAVNIIRALALASLLEQVASIKLADLTRRLRFRSLAFTGVAKALADTVVALSLAPFFGVWALVAGAFVGSATYTLLSYVVAPYRPRFYLDRHTVHGLIRYGRWILLTGLIAVAGAAVLRVLISNRLGTVELGIYFLAARVAFLPAEIAKEVIGAVAFPLYARLKSDVQEVARTYRVIFVGMFGLLTPMCGLIIVLAPSLVEDLLGPKWVGTLPIIQLLAIATIVSPIGELTVSLAAGLGQPYKATVLEGVQSLLAIGSACALIGGYGLIGVAFAWLIGTSASQGISVVFTRRILSRPFAKLGKAIAAICCASFTGAMVALWIDRYVEGIVGLSVAAIAGSAITVFLSWHLDRRLDVGFTRNLVKAYPPLERIIRPAPASL